MSRAGCTGVLGGTFDPIHRGHLDAIAASRRALDLEQVLVIPAHVSPHRSSQPRASSFHRFAMVALAIADQPGLVASDLELASPGPSYTSVTLHELARRGYEPSQLFFIAGADAFAEIATWHEYPALLSRAHFAVVSRPGAPAPALRDRLPELARWMHDATGGETARPASAPPSIVLIDAATAAVSSSDIRHRLACGQPVNDLVPRAVAAYIRRQHLYEPDDATPEPARDSR